MMGGIHMMDVPRPATAAGARPDQSFGRVEIGPDWICIRRTIAGLEAQVNVPTPSYRGVALRAVDDGGFEVVLLHADASLDIVLSRRPDDTDVIALWRDFGRRTNLRLLVEDADGRLQPVQDAPVAASRWRRYGSALKDRRPRFLARRASGRPEPMPVHCGEPDMFARA
jgi:hypothetical protein